MENIGKDGDNVIGNSTSDNSRKVVVDDQDEDENNVARLLISENSPRGMLDTGENGEEDVARKKSSANPPRGTSDNREIDEVNLAYQSSSEGSFIGMLDAEESGEEKDVSRRTSSENSLKGNLDFQDACMENVVDKSSSENSPREIIDSQHGDTENVADTSSGQSSPRRAIFDNVDEDEANVADKSSSKSSPRDIINNQDGDEENVVDKSILKNSPREIIDSRERYEENLVDRSSAENFPRDILGNSSRDEENVANISSLKSPPQDILDDQDGDQENMNDNSRLKSFRRDIPDTEDADNENRSDKSSLEISSKEVLDNQDRGKENVADKSSPKNFPRDFFDNEVGHKETVADRSGSENSSREILDNLDKGEKYVADQSSSEKSSPRDILDNEVKDKENVTVREILDNQDGSKEILSGNSSLEKSSPRYIFNKEAEKKEHVTDRSSSENSSRVVLDNHDGRKKILTDNSSSGNSPRDSLRAKKNVTDETSSESFPREILDNIDGDTEKVSDKSSLENSPRDILGNQDRYMKTVSDDSGSEKLPRDILDGQDRYKENVAGRSSLESSPTNILVNQDENKENVSYKSCAEVFQGDTLANQDGDEANTAHKSSSRNSPQAILDNQEEDENTVALKSSAEDPSRISNEVQENYGTPKTEIESPKVSEDSPKNRQMDKDRSPGTDNPNEIIQTAEEVDEEADPVFDGTEASDQKETVSSSSQASDIEPEIPTSTWPALKNFVKTKGVSAVSTIIRRLSGKKDENFRVDEEEKDANVEDSSTDSKQKETPQKEGERATWNPINYIIGGRETDTPNKSEHAEDGSVESSVPVMKGKIIVYTRLGCQDCKYVRSFMHQKRLKYVEINIDIYPSRKFELEKKTGSCAVPRVYFNDFLIGGLSELKAMDKSGKLDEKIDFVIREEPSRAAPLPPQSGEDDETGRGKIDEMASIVRKMKESIVLRDRYCKMRKFNNCFLGSEAVDFLSEDQYLEREEAVELGRKLASKHFFRHISDDNVFEDGNHLYRFLEHDPIVMSQCYNISWGTIDVKPKPITEIASRLRFLCFAMFEAYVSEDGRHVDYRSIHNSEEFQRYLRIVEELQRVDLDVLSREEKLAFFINLYNMMAIHAILTWGYPIGVLDRRRFLGDFKYVVGGCTYSLSAIQNGILRGNQRPPYNLMKSFGPKDKRFKIALPFPEPLAHFALVCGTRSGPALRCYSPGNIDKELVEAAHDFLRNGGLVVDFEAKVASVSRILWWYNVDFGKNEVEVLKHAGNYLEPEKSAELLELLANTQMKVIYQPYDWGLNS